MHLITDSSNIYALENIDDLYSSKEAYQHSCPEDLQSALTELLIGKICALILPINKLPIHNKDNAWTIAALAPRETASVKACFAKIDPSRKEALWLKPKALVHCDSDNVLAQVKIWHPEIQEINSAKAEALFYHGEKSITGGESLGISPAEIVPDTGNGILAVVVDQKEKELRRKLASMHHRPTSTVSNIERRATSSIQDLCNLHSFHCTIDKMKRYHLYAFTQKNGQSRKYHLIQNSWIGLVDNFMTEFNKKES